MHVNYAEKTQNVYILKFYFEKERKRERERERERERSK